METFENIYLDLSKLPGRCRFADNGMGWKPSAGGDTYTLDKSSMDSAQWSRAAKGQEIKILSRAVGVIQLDGFLAEDFDRISKCFKLWYGVNLEPKEHALRGWNWGKAEFGKSELVFNVQNRPAFEIPFSEISNTNLAGKNEVALELSLAAPGEPNGTSGTSGTTPNLGEARSRGTKAARGKDQLVEMRLYVPGIASKVAGAKDEEKNGSQDDEDGQEEQNAASLFYDTLMDKADIGDVAGDTIATFLDVLHLTPRGRFDIDMYDNSFRLRGKTYDYKIPYENIKKFMVMEKPDDVHNLVTIGLEPPLRQGQTRYPFLVMQFKMDEERAIDLNLTEGQLEGKYKGKLVASYENSFHSVVAQVFRGLSGRKILLPSKEFQSHHQQKGIKCSIKASEGFLYLFDKSMMFVPKPATYIAFENIVCVTMARLGGAMTASRTFDISISVKGGGADHAFSNINREEQTLIEAFFVGKNVRTKNEMLDDSSALMAAAMNEADMASSDEEVVAARADRGSADEDDESVDEDFQASDSSDDDVAEEYDSAHESSGGSDEEMEDAKPKVKGKSNREREVAERPKKKAKTDK